MRIKGNAISLLIAGALYSGAFINTSIAAEMDIVSERNYRPPVPVLIKKPLPKCKKAGDPGCKRY